MKDTNKQVIGKCGKCGGQVWTYVIWSGVTSPPKQCESCGATVNEQANLPTLPMNESTGPQFLQE